MLQSEFEELWGGCVTPRCYKEVIEPMYLALPEDYSKADFIDMLEPPRADEYRSYDQDLFMEHKKRFIHNLGWLLSQTRLDIESCDYHLETSTGEEYVYIWFDTGDYLKVNITADSFVAIVRDVCRKL